MENSLLLFYQIGRVGVIEDIMHRLNEIVRIKSGKQAQPGMVIIDCQSVKTTSVGGIRGFDANKNVNGRKRHVIVDTMGNVLSVIVHSAHLHETAMAELVVRRYNMDMEIIMRTDTNKEFKILPKRWVVEQTFAWFNGYRWLSKDYEFLTENSETAIHLAAIKINLNKF